MAVIESSLTGELPETPSIKSRISDVENVNFQGQKLRAAHKKVDHRLLIWYCIVYLILRIDALNITNTAIMNVETGHGIYKELGGITSQQWAWALSIFSYPYMFFEPFSTLLLKRFTPSKWMARIMLTWGIISMCQGATQNYGSLLACRFLLGAAEAGFYPGVIYHFSFWYSTERLPLRIAVFYASGVFSGAFSGLLAYAISFMNQAGGLSGWRWVFILEGIPAILSSVVTWFWLPNYPQTVSFLTEEEKDAIVEHLPVAAPTMNAKTWDLTQAKALFTTPTFIPYTLIWICHGIGGWGITLVLPTVIFDLGITDTARTQLMTIPPYVAAFFLLTSLGAAIRRKVFSPWIVALTLELTQVICYIIILLIHNPTARYCILIIAVAAATSLYPIIWPERIRAARGTTAVALAVGFTNAFAQFAGIIGPQVYQKKFGPRYKVSFSTSIALLAVVSANILMVWHMTNKCDKRDKKEEERGTRSVK